MSVLSKIFGANSKGENGLSLFIKSYKRASSANQFRVLHGSCVTETGRILTEIIPVAIEYTRDALKM